MRKWYPPVLIAVAVLVSAISYGHLPDEVPTHWDAHGNVDGYSPRAFGVFLLPMLMAGMWALMRALPSIDPRHENYPKMRGAYDLVMNATLTVLLATHVVVIAAMLGLPVSITRVLPVLVGAMFVVIGNVLPQARPNFFFGIRTPWTLSNDRVWQRTHRIGGYLFVGCGIVVVASALLPTSIAFPVLLGAGMVAALGSVLFSFIAWKQETSK